jgi:hypothetical protein
MGFELMKYQKMIRCFSVKVLLAVGICFGACRCYAQSNLAQYQDVIIASGAPTTVQDAAQDLQYHLDKIAGREFPLAHDKSTGGLHFYVGGGFFPDEDAKAAKLGNEGWMIASVPDGILLTGSHADSAKLSGVYHAVSLFLENQCGVRWLWPGESGEVIPRRSNLTFPDLHLSGTPPLRRRSIMPSYIRFWAPQQQAEWNTWSARTRQGDQLSANFGHAWASVIPPQKYFSAHPDWFALVNGKRIPAQLDTTNREMRDEFVKNLLALPGNQKLDIVSVSANDGYGFTENVPNGDTDAAYWDFVNDIATRVKKLRPGLGIGTFAYSYYRQPPKNIPRLPDNVYLSMTSYATQLMLPDERKQYLEFLNGWKSKGVKIVMREYWGMHYWLDLPVVYPREIADEIKIGYNSGMMGMYGEGGKNFATQAPNYYVLTHLMWNPDADPEKVLDDFYAAFGPSAKDVRRYYETFSAAVHHTWRAEKLAAGYVQDVNSYDEMFGPHTLNAARAALDAADKDAAGNPDLQKRLAFIRHGYDYTAVMSELIGLYKKLGRSGFPLESFEYQATMEPGRLAFQNPDFTTGNLDFFEARLKEPFHYTIPQQTAWLKRAWVLGQKRIEMLNASRHDFSLNEGLYAQTLVANIRQWHQTVGKYLGKRDADYVPLDYTKPKK